MQSAKGNCCGMSLCDLAVMDDVTVLHFDDMHFDDSKYFSSGFNYLFSQMRFDLNNEMLVRNSTRLCNNYRTFCCGGRGEQVLIDSRFCFGMCKRGRGLPCIPSCLPDRCCPCLVKVRNLSELCIKN